MITNETMKPVRKFNSQRKKSPPRHSVIVN